MGLDFKYKFNKKNQINHLLVQNLFLKDNFKLLVKAFAMTLLKLRKLG